MSYSSSVRMSIVDAIISNNSQLIFRLGTDSVYTSKMKLANVALVCAAGTGKYNMIAGNGQSIKRIALMDGGVVLDQLTSANMFYGFKKFNSSNRRNRSYNRRSVGNGLGFEFGNTTNSALTTGQISTNALSNTTALTFKSCIYLDDWIAMLRSTDYLSTNLFKDLRVVVEYDLSNLNCGAGTVVTTIGAVTPADDPLLVVEEIVREDIKQQIEQSLGSFTWFGIESDVVQVNAGLKANGDKPNAAGETVVQTTSLQYRGFNNKYIRRVLLVNTGQNDATASPNLQTDNAVIGAGNLSSTANLQERLNFIVNGALVLPTACERANEKLGMLVDTWGEVNAPLGVASTGIFGGSDNINGSHNFEGRLAYSGLNVSSRIQSLKVQLTRTCQFNDTRTAAYTGGIRTQFDQYNCPLLVTMFAEVRKAIVVQPNGTYSISYVY